MKTRQVHQQKRALMRCTGSPASISVSQLSSSPGRRKLPCCNLSPPFRRCLGTDYAVLILTKTSGWMRIIQRPLVATCENGSLRACPCVNSVRLTTPTLLRAPTLIVSASGTCDGQPVLRTRKDFLPFFATVTTILDRKSAAAPIEAVSLNGS